MMNNFTSFSKSIGKWFASLVVLLLTILYGNNNVSAQCTSAPKVAYFCGLGKDVTGINFDHGMIDYLRGRGMTVTPIQVDANANLINAETSAPIAFSPSDYNLVAFSQSAGNDINPSSGGGSALLSTLSSMAIPLWTNDYHLAQQLGYTITTNSAGTPQNTVFITDNTIPILPAGLPNQSNVQVFSSAITGSYINYMREDYGLPASSTIGSYASGYSNGGPALLGSLVTYLYVPAGGSGAKVFLGYSLNGFAAAQFNAYTDLTANGLALLNKSFDILGAVGSSSQPTAGTPIVNQATCNAAGTAANNDASISISGITNATAYAYTTNGTDPSFASAMAISGGTISLTNLPNPASATTYKFRIFNGSANCYIDISATLNPTTCSPSCTPPNAAAPFVSQATCNAAGTAANNDAYIMVNPVSSATHYAYTSDGTDPSFASAVAVSGSSITIMNLPNPASATTYKIRIFNGSATCYTDVSTILNPKVCSPSCSMPNVAPPTATQATCNAAGTAANNDASISISAVNTATSYAYTSDGTDPAFASAVAISGSSITISNLPNPASATTYKIRVFNGSATCYTDVSTVLNPKVCSPSCSMPNVAPPTATQATCNAAGTAANNDASITISAVNTATSYAYTSDGTAPSYASAIALSGSSITISNLPNPASATTYTIRVFNGSATCYTDVSTVLNPKVCSPSCVLPNVAPPTATQATCNAAGTAANNDASVTISAVNTATSYAYTSDGTDPAFASAVAISGSSITISNLPNPASATTYKIRVFNGSATCYTDVSTILNPKVCSPSCVLPNVAPPTATQATCNAAGTAANNDASVTISAVNTATSYAYTSDGTDPAFASAVTISGSSITISNLPNPASATTYKIRVFNGSATCYTDVSTVLNPKICSPSCSTPDAGANQTICLPKTTLNLTDAPSGYQWVAAPGNTPVATINATTGEITGMNAVGTYGFRLQKTTDATCYDEMQVVVTNGEAVIVLCNDGSTSYTLIAQAGVTNVKWFNMNAMQVGTGNSIIISAATTGLEDGTEAFYYTATVVADGCDAELCCPVKFATQNCCPVPNCLSITVIKK